MTNTEKIISTLKQDGESCDDCIAKSANISPRQTVNQICRLLENRGELIRKRN